MIQSLACKFLIHLSNEYKDETSSISPASSSDSHKLPTETSTDYHELRHEDDDCIIEVPDTIENSFKQMIENHYENWIKMRNPSLGNKTPLQFAKTKKGKEIIKELLKVMENELARNNSSDLPPFPFEMVKERLRL